MSLVSFWVLAWSQSIHYTCEAGSRVISSLFEKMLQEAHDEADDVMVERLELAPEMAQYMYWPLGVGSISRSTKISRLANSAA